MPLPRLSALLMSSALAVIALSMLSGCDTGAIPIATPVISTTPTSATLPTGIPRPSATPKVVVIGTSTPTPIPEAERRFVPVFSYHHVRDWEHADTEDDRAYIMPPSKLEAQLNYLHENGYQAVTAEQVAAYYASGRPLPDKPVMLSFDDNVDNQYTSAVPLLKKYGLNATFFVMTVTIDKENFMTGEQLKELDGEGFDIQPHTWDHRMVTEYETEADWQQQIVEPKKTLEELLGHPTQYFAYPFGVYDARAAGKLKDYGYKAAFRLRDVMDEVADPLFAIKRYIANGYWTQDQFETVVTGGWE